MKNNKKGFTLIETLVVSGIFLTIITIVLSVLVTILRGSKNSDASIIVRQNGEHAINQLVKHLRYAKNLDYPSTAGGAIPACSSTGISVKNITITNIDLTQATFSCPSTSASPNFISYNGTSLTNSNTVVVKNCNFICKQEDTGPPTIAITFTLSKINNSGMTEDNTTIPFQSSVTLRNITDAN